MTELSYYKITDNKKCSYCNRNTCYGYVVFHNPDYGINEVYSRMCVEKFRVEGVVLLTHHNCFMYWSPEYPEYGCYFEPPMKSVLDELNMKVRRID